MGEAVSRRILTSDDPAGPVHVGICGGHTGKGTGLINSNAETGKILLLK